MMKALRGRRMCESDRLPRRLDLEGVEGKERDVDGVETGRNSVCI